MIKRSVIFSEVSQENFTLFYHLLIFKNWLGPIHIKFADIRVLSSFLSSNLFNDSKNFARKTPSLRKYKKLLTKQAFLHKNFDILHLL